MDTSYLSRTSAGSAGISDATRPASAINLAHNALEEARELAARVNTLVDRLVGAQPEKVSETLNKISGPGSVFGALRENADRTVDILRAAHGRLNILDNEIV